MTNKLLQNKINPLIISYIKVFMVYQCFYVIINLILVQEVFFNETSDYLCYANNLVVKFLKNIKELFSLKIYYLIYESSVILN